jgi:hypothetical protein
LAFYNYGDRIYYTKNDEGLIITRFHYKDAPRVEYEPHMFIKIALDKDICYMTYKSIHTYNVAFYVDGNLQLTKRGCDEEKDIILENDIDYYESMIYHYQDVSQFANTTMYDDKFYMERVL